MGLEGPLVVAAIAVGLGFVLCLKGLVMWRGVYAMRGVMLLVIGGAVLVAPRPASSQSGHSPVVDETLLQAQREKLEVERSLRCSVRPLVSRCQRELAYLDSSPAALGQDERGRARDHLLRVLHDAQSRQREHEQALGQLDAAIAGLERERTLTQVKDVTHARALARTTLFELGTTTQAELDGVR
jgi:hypothetical protein